jgi:hypothetical protein
VDGMSDAEGGAGGLFLHERERERERGGLGLCVLYRVVCACDGML